MTDGDKFFEIYRGAKDQTSQSEAKGPADFAFDAFVEDLFRRLLDRNGSETLSEDGLSIVKAGMPRSVAVKSDEISDKYLLILTADGERRSLRVLGYTTGEFDLDCDDLDSAEAHFAEILGIESSKSGLRQ